MLAWWAGRVEPSGRVQKVVCDPIKCKSTRRSLMGKQESEASQVTDSSLGPGHQKPFISLTWPLCLWNTEHVVILYLRLWVVT